MDIRQEKSQGGRTEITNKKEEEWRSVRRSEREDE
jgi:hypothetical protein